MIHGIGDEKRNETLQEALNAITYWFNHKTGLAQRPQGPGRVWVTTELTNEENPDAPASRATVELQAPANVAGLGASEADTLRLEMREVWWAQAFGLPPVGTALAWAGRQFLEELRVLVPVNVRSGSGPASVARRAPAREIPQAATYRPQASSAPTTPAAVADSVDGRQWVLRAALWFYGGMQYLWKLFQWIALAPVVGLLVLLIPLLRVLSLLPFIQAVAIRSVSNLVDYVSLHWVAPLQVYLLDYTRSSAIRQLFEREVESFLRDEHCERVVVIAHSLGTVVAYEGLATGLMKPELQRIQKPITFICLAQALRRLWRLQGTDQHRLRYALPEHVRWLHFWARYDPVAAGPLGAYSLPQLFHWQDSEIADPYDDVCATLDRCENVDVVNTDSLFSDHTTYWNNVEQVVGPIARELVAGHPALEQLVRAHLATPGDVLRRRGDVAWRQTVAVASGTAAAIALFMVDSQNKFGLGKGIQEFTPNLPGLLDQLATGGAIGKLLSQRTTGGHEFIAQVFTSVAVYPFFTALAALVLLSACIWLAGRFVAAPSPFVFRGTLQTAFRGWSASFFLSVSVILWALVVIVPLLVATPSGSDADTGTIVVLGNLAVIALGVLVVALWLTSLVDTRNRQRWGWFLALVFAPFIIVMSLVTGDLIDLSLFTWLYWSVGLLAGFVYGCGLVVLTVRALRDHRWWWAIGLGLSTLLALASIPALLAFVAPAFVYGLWSGPARIAPRHAQTSLRSERRARMLALATLSLVLLYSGYFLITLGAYRQEAARLGIVVLIGAATLSAGVAVGIGLVDSLRERRWSWLIMLPIGMLAGLTLFSLFLYPLYLGTSVGSSLSSSTVGHVTSVIGFLVCPTLLAGTLVYGLWAGPSRRLAPEDKGRLVPIYSGAQGTPVSSALQALHGNPVPQFRSPAPPPPAPAGWQQRAPQQRYPPAQWPAPPPPQQPWQPAPPPAGQPHYRPGFPLAQPDAAPPPAYAPPPPARPPAPPSRQPGPENEPPPMQSGGAPGGTPQS